MNNNDQSTNITPLSPQELKKQFKKYARREAKARQEVEQANRELARARQKLTRSELKVQQLQKIVQDSEAKLTRLHTASIAFHNEIMPSSLVTEPDIEASDLLALEFIDEQAEEAIYEVVKELVAQEEDLPIFDANETVELTAPDPQLAEQTGNIIDLDTSSTRELVIEEQVVTIEETPARQSQEPLDEVALEEQLKEIVAAIRADEQLEEISNATLLEEQLIEAIVAVQAEEELEKIASEIVEEQLAEVATATEIEEKRAETLAEEELGQVAEALVEEQLAEVATATEIEEKRAETLAEEELGQVAEALVEEQLAEVATATEIEEKRAETLAEIVQVEESTLHAEQDSQPATPAEAKPARKPATRRPRASTSAAPQTGTRKRATSNANGAEQANEAENE